MQQNQSAQLNGEKVKLPRQLLASLTYQSEHADPGQQQDVDQGGEAENEDGDKDRQHQERHEDHVRQEKHPPAEVKSVLYEEIQHQGGERVD